jgi:hypothetical protein
LIAGKFTFQAPQMGIGVTAQVGLFQQLALMEIASCPVPPAGTEPDVTVGENTAASTVLCGEGTVTV